MGLMLILCAGIQLHAQNGQLDRTAFAQEKTRAEQGNAVAQSNLGKMYAQGRGVLHDDAEAARWFRKAAEQGNADAQCNLGFLYAGGEGVPLDYTEAAKWFLKAAEQGDSLGQCNLAGMYVQGHGVAHDDVEAARWFREAAAQGNAIAQGNLGAMYANGDGVPRNYVEAYKWNSLAASQGQVNGKSNLSKNESRMTPEQIAEAQRLARDFRPSQKAELIPFLPPPLTQDASPRATGTGFFITQDGFLVTAAHVVNGANQIRLVTGAGLLTARLVKLDAANDIALLKADGHFTPLPIVSSRAVKLGNTVATVGFPNAGLQGLSPKLAKGEIASLAGNGDDPHYFQISVPVQPGNSGGALVDEHGNVIGVVAAKLNAATALATSGALPENVNYAVKSTLLLGLLESVPEATANLKDPNTKDRKFEDVIDSAEKATVMIMIY
jgi:S1-C subfamily serine protease